MCQRQIFFSQNDSLFVKKGTIKAMATLSPSKIFSKNLSPFYLHVNLEYYLENKISVSSDAYYFLGDMSKGKTIFNFHHSVFFGANYHFINGNNDVYLGLHPGISITELKYYSQYVSINPLISITAGYNFYLNKFFHFFIQIRSVYGENTYIPMRLVDIRISAGLGFNL